MIQKIHIENYKSVQSLDIELGRLNVFIGANGCGKTNILEAIALGGAAAADKLDNEFLGSRGIRVTEYSAMKSGFTDKNVSDPIYIDFLNEKKDQLNLLINQHEENPYSWYREIKGLRIPVKEISGTFEKYINENIQPNGQKIDFYSNPVFAEKLKELLSEAIIKNIEQFSHVNIFKFLIFSPENYFLRRFEEESQIKPLGIRGEGLFSHLVDLIQKSEIFNKIKEHLQLIDWFDDFGIPNDLIFSQRKLRIIDRFIAEGLQYFDQRSANEGFLYLLFYVTLFVSPYTPKFFAIDNIDNSLNPKLCSELTKMLAQLAKDHDKQAILTTHNPAILDGLNLNDDEQRLFVIYRNADGHTKAKRVFKKEMPNGMEPVKLSEQFLRGYIGGLNRNF